MSDDLRVDLEPLYDLEPTANPTWPVGPPAPGDLPGKDRAAVLAAVRAAEQA